jgi:hypothetical protein
MPTLTLNRSPTDVILNVLANGRVQPAFTHQSLGRNVQPVTDWPDEPGTWLKDCLGFGSNYQGFVVAAPAAPVHYR